MNRDSDRHGRAARLFGASSVCRPTLLRWLMYLSPHTAITRWNRKLTSAVSRLGLDFRDRKAEPITFAVVFQLCRRARMEVVREHPSDGLAEAHHRFRTLHPIAVRLLAPMM